jgi:hypothetical protein
MSEGIWGCRHCTRKHMLSCFVCRHTFVVDMKNIIQQNLGLCCSNWCTIGHCIHKQNHHFSSSWAPLLKRWLLSIHIKENKYSYQKYNKMRICICLLCMVIPGCYKTPSLVILRPCLHETGMKWNRNENWNCQYVYMRTVRKSQNFHLIPLAKQFSFLHGFC